jgi:hypothetical protein
MPCESYKDALNSVAVGAPVTSELRSHLDGCAPCHAVLGDEQALLASIDAGLRAVANIEAPPSLIPGVRVRLAEERAPRRASLSLRMVGACAAALLLITFTFVGLRRPPAPRVELPLRATTQPPKSFAAAADPPQLDVTPFPRSGGPRLATASSVAARSASRVLVPPDEREAFAHLVIAMERQSALAATLAKPGLASSDAPLAVDPIRIAALEVKPLSEDEVPASSGATRN